MLLDNFLAIAELGAEKPIHLSEDKFRAQVEVIIPQLEKIIEATEPETEVYGRLIKLKEELAQVEFDDYALAKIFMGIASVFLENTPLEKQGVVNNFRRSLDRFYKRSQMFETFSKKRETVSRNLTDEQILNHDQNLSKTIGMMYVLEYLLIMHKAIEENQDDTGKMLYVTSREVRMDAGTFPGLWFDFNSDEILSAFILDLLNDKIREELVSTFYDTKSVFQQISVECNMEGQCSAQYNPSDVDRLVGQLKTFIQKIIQVYLSIGIENLTSVFLSPYGEKTKLVDLPF